MEAQPTFVLYEDRPNAVVGLQLSVASLLRHSPSVHVRVYLEGDAARSADWFRAYSNNIEVLSSVMPSDLRGWNVKPDLLLAALDDGAHRAIWLDSDVLVCGDLRPRLDVPRSWLIATEDTWYGSGQVSGRRTTAWHLEVGNLLPATLNTALLAVTDSHVDLIVQWRQMLANPTYRQAQAGAYASRPEHLVGDQDVLTALVESSQWADVRVDLLRRGLEIAQCHSSAGFSPSERMRLGKGGVPLLVHAMGVKPWTVLSRTPRADYWSRSRMQLSPYVNFAREYDGILGEPLPWTHSTTLLARALKFAFNHDPVLQELPLSACQALVWRARQDAGRLRRRVASAHG